MIETVLVETTGLLGLFTGLLVLALGDWHQFKLKYAGVALSTSASALVLLLHYVNDNLWSCSSDLVACDLQTLIHTMRNLAFIIFHVTSGRDALRYKAHDRRSCEINKEEMKKVA